MLELKDITKIYTKNGSRFIALNKVSIKIEEGNFVAVIGASGSGKSTLLNIIGGLNQPDAGQVLFRRTDIYKQDNKKNYAYLQENIGFVFQQFHLIPFLTVYENIKMATSDSRATKNITAYLKKCGMLSLRNKYPSELSVGEKQRTAFIWAIISNPNILLADEPTGNLDTENSHIIMSLIQEFHKNGGTVILVSHESEMVKYASRVVTLNTGEIQ